MAYNFTAIEQRWQQYWLANKTFAALDPADAAGMPKAYVLDMFPYPSGAGLHVGHPEGYTATDIVSRYLRAQGYNVLHPMGWDAFGLPAEQYAIQNNVHPAETTRRQHRHLPPADPVAGAELRLGPRGRHDRPRLLPVDAVDLPPAVQQLLRPAAGQGDADRPSGGRAAERELRRRPPDGSVRINPTTEGLSEVVGGVRLERLWRELTPDEQRQVVDGQRLAYQDEVPVNWCPGLGTVLSNEEVIDGKSERGGFPVERRPLRQWLLRITAYADRLIADLDGLDWPASLKEMQRNWIGRSVGAEIDFAVAEPEDTPSSLRRLKEVHEDAADDLTITVFTTRPDTLYGATYMVLAPEHPLVDRITPPPHRETIEAYRTVIAGKSERDRQADTGGKATRPAASSGRTRSTPVNGEKLPIFIADYVLMGYGTGAIMAVPAHDQRDFDFAQKFDLPIRQVVESRGSFTTYAKSAYVGDGVAVNSGVADGQSQAEARRRRRSSPSWSGTGRPTGRRSTSCGTGCSAASGTGASRSRSCWTTRAGPRRCRSRSCRCGCRRWPTSSRPARRSRR